MISALYRKKKLKLFSRGSRNNGHHSTQQEGDDGEDKLDKRGLFHAKSKYIYLAYYEPR